MSLPDLANLHFLRPLWLAAIPVAVAIAIAFARRTRLRSRWQDVIDAELRAAMLEEPALATSRALPWFAATALAATCLILAGPTWLRLPQNVVQRNDALVLVLDLSLSMYAGDLQPSRLTRARHKLVDILRRRPEGYTALIAYAGDAHVVAPLTDDVGTIENLLGALSPAIMPVLGSNAAPALEEARSLLQRAGTPSGRILLVTDGIDRIADVSERCSRAQPVSILGVGTPEGAPIPLDFVDQPGRFLTDRAGVRIVARLDDDRLRQAAAMCGGHYERIAVGDTDIDALLATAPPLGEATTATDRTFDLWQDMGQYLTLALVPFALLGFRRGVLFAVLVVVGIPAHAGIWDDLWQRRDQQGVAALRDGEPERATQLLDDPQWQGVARYRSGSYAAAEQRFREAPDAAGHYNRGNALAHQGRYQDAIAAYDAALRLQPDDADAKYNKALLERLLQQLQLAAGQPHQSSPDQTDRNEAESSRADGNPAQQRSQRDEKAEAAPGKNERGTPEQKGERAGSRADARAEGSDRETPRDEKQDAADQWLRRIPDDPGGLLRRKFQFETSQRMRHGGYPSREEKIW